jgi:hypothetical protein
MANTKISALTELAVEPANDDVLPIVDTSVTTTKKIQYSTMKSAIITATLGSITAINYVYKSTNGTINNSGTLTSDAQLLFPVTASYVYRFEMTTYFSSGTTPDIKFGWSVPSGATMYWGADNAASNLANPPDGILTAGSVSARAGGANTAQVIHNGVVFMGTVSGTVTLQWAQNTANASNTIVYAGSNIEYSRLA